MTLRSVPCSQLALKVGRPTEVVTSIVTRLQPRASERSIKLSLAAVGRGSTTFDSGLFGQTIWNLVDNAIRFTPEGGEVDISLEMSGKEMVVAVEDSGRGLGVDDANVVFERFCRADSARTHDSGAGGTGLGLAIVGAVAEAHGGVATAENRVEGGARFTLRFPSLPEIPNEGVVE